MTITTEMYSSRSLNDAMIARRATNEASIIYTFIRNDKLTKLKKIIYNSLTYEKNKHTYDTRNTVNKIFCRVYFFFFILYVKNSV